MESGPTGQPARAGRPSQPCMVTVIPEPRADSTLSIPLGRLPRRSMGTREDEQPPLWIAASALPTSPGPPFYTRLNAVLDAAGYDRSVERGCRLC